MVEARNARHYSDFENFIKKSKRDFDARWRAEFRPNAAIGDFNLKKTLGTGSFGRVILVNKKKEPEKLFAIKMMEKDHVVKTKQVAHTISEIRMMDAMRFQFLVYMEYFFKDNVYLFLGMPFVNGGEMFVHLRIMKKFDETMSKFYAAQVILAFEYMHSMGVIYRDLKPENILIDSEGFLRVTDFGFCKKVDDQRTYTLCGTPEYLAPEIILSQGYNKSVDWWALGILIYEMNAGFPPFYARDPMKIYEKIVAGKFTIPAHFSKSLRDLVPNIIQVDRTKRFGILKSGTKDIKTHEWFKSVEWDALLDKKFKPTFKPRVKGPDDTSNFDHYEEEPFRTSPAEEYAEEFAQFTILDKIIKELQQKGTPYKIELQSPHSSLHKLFFILCINIIYNKYWPSFTLHKFNFLSFILGIQVMYRHEAYGEVATAKCL